VEKSAKLLEQQLNESANKCDEAQRQLSDMNSQKNRLSNEKNALQAQVEQLEASNLALNKAKQQMACQVEEARRQSDEEARAKSSLAQQLRNMNVELEEVKAQLEDEHSQRCEIQKGLSKANADAQQWKSRFEADSLAKEDELEEQRRKFSAKLAESQEQVEASTAKCLSLEKTKAHLQADIEDLMAEVCCFLALFHFICFYLKFHGTVFEILSRILTVEITFTNHFKTDQILIKLKQLQRIKIGKVFCILTF
jgi:chromosome segregation ATPase